MDITFFLVMLVCLYPILWILLGVFISSAKWKKGILMGVSLSEKESKDPEVLALARRCRRSLLLLAVPFTLALIPIYFIPYVSVATFCWFLWILLAMAAPMPVFHHYYRRLKSLKASRGWEDDPEDRFWLWGMFYRNPDDLRKTVPKRVGVGTTMNTARRSWKVLMVFLAVCFLSMPALGIWLMAEDFTPMKAVILDDGVEVRHLESEFFVAYDDVETVALLTEPPALSRSIGTSLTYLEKGNYNVRGYGSCRICMDRRDPVILVLETEEETYLISFESKAEAEAVIGRIDIVK